MPELKESKVNVNVKVTEYQLFDAGKTMEAKTTFKNRLK